MSNLWVREKESTNFRWKMWPWWQNEKMWQKCAVKTWALKQHLQKVTTLFSMIISVTCYQIPNIVAIALEFTWNFVEDVVIECYWIIQQLYERPIKCDYHKELRSVWKVLWYSTSLLLVCCLPEIICRF